MDVRCEKCQTEYELDEARLKPGGVTVKCTHCGYMFKIRKRTITNVGHIAGASGGGAPREGSGATRSRPQSSKPLAAKRRPDSIFDDDARTPVPDEMPTTVERQWLLRLDNGEQKSCRELATLQQWIVSGVVTRDSLISRTGKTWKRLGDIADLSQYFEIADEARATRDRARPISRPPGPGDAERRGMGTPTGRGLPTLGSSKDPSSTIHGYAAPQAAGGTILPDDPEDEPDPREAYTRPGRAVRPANTPPPLPTRGVSRTPGPVPTLPGSGAAAPPVTVPPLQGGGGQGAARDLRSTPPPLPRRAGAASGPATLPASGPVSTGAPPAIPPPVGNRATADWAQDGVTPEVPELPPSGPVAGKLAAIPDEPAFAGRVRIAPGDAAPFDPSRVRVVEEDDPVLPARRGSRAGMWVLAVALVVMGAGAAAIYLLVLRPGDVPAPLEPGSAAPVAVVAVDARPADALAVAPTTPPSAAETPPAAVAGPRADLAADLEPRLRAAAQALDGKLDAPSQALRAHLLAQLAQDLQDRAGLASGPASDPGDALRNDAKQLVLDAATSAQRALRAAADDPGANVAMAEVLRLQGKPARDIQRYLDMARARPDKDWTLELELASALVQVRDGKLDDARAALAGILAAAGGPDGSGGSAARGSNQGDGKLETTSDVRARLHLALVLAAQGKPAEAKPLVDAVLAAQPEHAVARALAAKLETAVVRSDPLPPEESSAAPPPSTPPPGPPAPPASKTPPPSSPVPPASKPPRSAPAPAAEAGDPYDRLLARANTVAETSCARAMELYARALEQRPNGVEALAGMGYCHIEAKQFASAFSKFRAALAVSSRYEPALRGIAEAYLQQGRKDQAIESYRAYLEVFPDNAAAKKQLERLTGDTAAPAAPAPAQTAPPSATPPSEPPGAGSGSG